MNNTFNKKSNWLARFFCTFFCLFFCLFCAFNFIGCGKKCFSLVFNAFNTDIYIEVNDFDFSKQEKLQLSSTIESLDSTFSTSIVGSFTQRLNDLEIGENIAINDEVKQVLLLSKEYGTFLGGLFNISTLPLSMLWHFAEGYKVDAIDFIPPTDSQISTTLSNYNYDLSSLEIIDYSLTKKENIKIDFGGILKGYASNILSDILVKFNHNSGYINIGGSSLSLLKVDSLSIVHPNYISQNIIEIKNLNNISISTSGTYRKYYVFGGKTYSHIISPFSGKPADTNIVSAVALGENGCFLDAVSTALCLSSFDLSNPTNCPLFDLSSKVLLSDYGVKSIFIIYDDGLNKKIITNEKQGSFSLLDDDFEIITYNIDK